MTDWLATSELAHRIVAAVGSLELVEADTDAPGERVMLREFVGSGVAEGPCVGVAALLGSVIVIASELGFAQNGRRLHATLRQ